MSTHQERPLEVLQHSQNLSSFLPNWPLLPALSPPSHHPKRVQGWTMLKIFPAKNNNNCRFWPFSTFKSGNETKQARLPHCRSLRARKSKMGLKLYMPSSNGVRISLHWQWGWRWEKIWGDDSVEAIEFGTTLKGATQHWKQEGWGTHCYPERAGLPSTCRLTLWTL